jgi:superfamily I DNA/RNA helicase
LRDTRDLAERADFLLRTGRCPYPRRILAVCFKVDAARTCESELAVDLGHNWQRGSDSLTFHAFAKHLIDNYRSALTGQNALGPDYRIALTTRIAREQITLNDLVPLAL